MMFWFLSKFSQLDKYPDIYILFLNIFLLISPGEKNHTIQADSILVTLALSQSVFSTIFTCYILVTESHSGVVERKGA